MAKESTAQTHLPLTEATFLVLVSLVAGPQHGYAIMKDVRDLSEGRVVLGTGTLYGALKRLLERGWIRRADDGPAEEETGRVRKVYALTDLGRRILDAETERLQALVAVSRARAGVLCTRAGASCARSDRVWPPASIATVRVAGGRG
jgi:DNA-binding PadR family transcriptional regulator